MAKGTADGLGLRLQGKVGNVVFVQTRTGLVIRPRTVPANPRTPAQVASRQRLAQAIEHYAARFPIAYRDMRNGHPAPALRELIEEVIEAVGARPE